MLPDSPGMPFAGTSAGIKLTGVSMKLIALFTLALVTAFPAVSVAQARLNEQELQFLEQAAQSGMLEIQASQLALQSASAKSVKQYAQLMLIEHEKISGDLLGLVSTRDIPLPTELDGELRATLADLQQEQDAEFDRRYIDEVAINAHEVAVKRFQEMAKETQNPDISAFVNKSLPVLQEHLDHAKSIAATLNAER